jgi:diketogulonate reductase-like aldo/keto reductase
MDVSNLISKISTPNNIPLKGLGTYNINDEVFDRIIEKAIELGYRHFDTASYYKNEKKLGQVLNHLIREKKVARSELFIVTKLWNEEKEDVQAAIKRSLQNLEMDYIDLYLIHWPMGYYAPDKKLKLIPLHETWKQMEDCVKQGLAKKIGVSNFNVQLLLDLLSYADIKPAANQIELHPFLSQEKLVEFCQSNGCDVISYGSLTRGKRKH